MYSPHSPTFSGTLNGVDQNHYAFGSSLRRHNSPSTAHLSLANEHLNQKQFSTSPAGSYSTGTTSSSHPASSHYLSSMTAAAAAAAAAANSGYKSIQCLRLKYFTTFFVCTTCLALLSASLATHKWLVSRPMRILRLNNGQLTNLTALKLSAHEQYAPQLQQRQSRFHINQEQQQQESASQQQDHQASDLFAMASLAAGHDALQTAGQASNKFQGEIYFGLFNGVKVLNYGFGNRVSQLSVLQPFYGPNQPSSSGSDQLSASAAAAAAAAAASQNQHELVNFKLWLATLTGVVLAILFALMGSIFAIINFVMTPRGTITGPVGLVIWNAAACFSCLFALFAWLVEYFVRLKSNVLTPEEARNGWTSENRSQFGYSYYFVLLAFVLHLVNIFIVSIVQAETWTNQSIKVAGKRQSRTTPCEGVIMLY